MSVTNPTTTAMQTDATDFHAALQAAYDRAEQVAAEKARLEAQAELTRQAALEAREIAEAAAQAVEAIAVDQAKADADIITASHAIPTDPITSREQAIGIANDLDSWFKKWNARDTGFDVDNDPLLAKLWAAIDEADWKTTTTDIAPEAQAVVLAIEGVVDACNEFARFRSADFQNNFGEERRKRDNKPTIDVRAVRSPSDSRLVQTLLVELRNVIDGVEPNRKIESIGELFRQGVSPQQMALMAGLVNADGSGQPEVLGMIVDRALARTGFYSEVSGVQHIIRLGALDREDALKIRTLSIEQRRESLQSRRGHDGRSGNLPRTEASTIDNEPEFEPAFGRAVASYEERREAQRAELKKRADWNRDRMLIE